MIKKISIFLLATFLMACEKEIDLKLADKSGALVIEGSVSNEAGPYTVKISRSVAFTSPNQYPGITEARVVLSDDLGQTETLVHRANGRYESSSFESQPGRTYTLKVLLEGTTYVASSRMPALVELDSLRQNSIKFGSEIRYNVIPLFTDPAILGNYYRFLVYVNGKRDSGYPHFADNTNNGEVNQRPLFFSGRDEEEVKPGDEITIEMRSIDASGYTYFSALDQLAGGGAGGGITPANPPGNFSGGALGLFSAYSVSRKSIVIR